MSFHMIYRNYFLFIFFCKLNCLINPYFKRYRESRPIRNGYIINTIKQSFRNFTGGERGRVPDSAQIMASMSSTGGKETLDRTRKIFRCFDQSITDYKINTFFMSPFSNRRYNSTPIFMKDRK